MRSQQKEVFSGRIFPPTLPDISPTFRQFPNLSGFSRQVSPCDYLSACTLRSSDKLLLFVPWTVPATPWSQNSLTYECPPAKLFTTFRHISKLEAKDVLPNINHTQAAKKPINAVFLLMATLNFDIQTRPSNRQTHLPSEFRANLFSSSQDISHTNKKKVTDRTKTKTEPYTVNCVR